MEKLMERGKALIISEWFKKHVDKEYAKMDEIVRKHRENFSLR